MKAAVIEKPKACRLEEVDVPEAGPDQVLIRVEGTGICASDLPVWEGRPWFEYPLEAGRPGHEGWGVIEAVGSNANGFAPGDRVAAFAMRTYAGYTLADAADTVALSPALEGKPFPGEPMACAMNSFKRCNIAAGMQVAIIGGGFQGLLLTQLAAHAGAQVVVLSRRKSGLDFALSMGADAVIEMDDHQRVLNEAMKLARGDGYDVVIEATGYQWPLDLAGELTRTRGRLVISGYHQDPRQVNMQLWNWRGIDVVNAHERDPQLYVQGMKEAMESIAQERLRPWPLLTHHFPLSDLSSALNTACERPDGFLKALVFNE